MKLDLCDVCLKEDGKLTPAKFKIGIPGVRVSVCSAHENFFPRKTKREAFSALAMPVINGAIDASLRI